MHLLEEVLRDCDLSSGSVTVLSWRSSQISGRGQPVFVLKPPSHEVALCVLMVVTLQLRLHLVILKLLQVVLELVN